MDKNYDDFGVQIMSDSEVEFCCFLCYETFKVEEVWRYHVEAHEKESKAVEDYSNTEKFQLYMKNKFFRELNAVEEDQSDTEKFDYHMECGVCKKKLETQKELMEHSKNEICFPYIVQCWNCLRISRAATQEIDCDCLTRGMDCEEVEVFKCLQCDQTFNQMRYLKRHERNYHPKPEKHKCFDCCQSFNSMLDLINHEKSHNKIKLLYRCTKCGKYFNDSKSLSRHQMIHVKNL